MLTYIIIGLVVLFVMEMVTSFSGTYYGGD